MFLAPGYMYLMIFDVFLFVQLVSKVSTCDFFTLLFFASSLSLKNNRGSHGVVVLGTPDQEPLDAAARGLLNGL